MEHKCIRYIPLPVLRSYRCLSFVVVQPLSCVLLFVTQWTAAHQASLSFTISWSLPKFMSIAMVMLSSHLILWCLLFLLPSILPSIRDFSNESVLSIWWPKYWSFSFSISPSNEYLGLISLKIDWFDLLAVQGTLRHLLQYHINSLALCLLKGWPGMLQFMELQRAGHDWVTIIHSPFGDGQ